VVATAGPIPAPWPAAIGTEGVGTSSALGPTSQLVTLENGRSTAFDIATGQRVVLGRGPGADIVISDARVSPVHALVERRGPGWLVTGLDANNPTWILDPTGRPHPVSPELGLRSGTLLVGGCQVLLYPPRI
jgi:pSer/pThr/pTyr-binding forkhead associated (FHA) protein